ncbi:MAG: hypothetical protein AAFN78_03550 [Pseudomonadota bacterium]
MIDDLSTAGRKARRFLVVALAIASTGAWADEEPATEAVNAEQARAVVRAIFDRLDCDLDGTVETAEVDDHFAQVWAPSDRDRSRALSPVEYSRLHYTLSDEQGRGLFADADADADGKITAGELRLHLQRMIRHIDADNDNEVTRADAGLKSAGYARPFAKRPKTST